jgi:hypothetical protein
MSSTRSVSVTTPSTPNSKSNKFAFKQNNFLVGMSSMEASSSSQGNHHTKLSKSSSSDKHISFNLNNNIVIGSSSSGSDGTRNGSSNDPKLASFVQEPTTPNDKIDTPRTVTVKNSFPFPPISPPPIVDSDISSLNGKI